MLSKSDWWRVGHSRYCLILSHRFGGSPYTDLSAQLCGTRRGHSVFCLACSICVTLLTALLYLPSFSFSFSFSFSISFSLLLSLSPAAFIVQLLLSHACFFFNLFPHFYLGNVDRWVTIYTIYCALDIIGSSCMCYVCVTSKIIYMLSYVMSSVWKFNLIWDFIFAFEFWIAYSFLFFYLNLTFNFRNTYS